MTSTIDVSQLAVRREEPRGPRIAAGRHLLARYVLPATLVLGFLTLLAFAARDTLRPAHEVTVMPVIARRGAAEQAGQPLFTAAGWVEARPTPVLVAALAEGVVQRLLVVEGQAVEAGQPVAQLNETDARLALRQAEANVKVKEADLQSARAVLAAARTNLEHPVQLESALAEAESLLAHAEMELGGLPFTRREAEARLRLAQQDLDRKTSAGEAVPGRDLARAQAEFDRATAELQALEARKPRLAVQVDALKRRCDALQEQFQRKTTEKRDLADAEAKVLGAEAHLRQAQLAVEAAQLCLERMTIKAPVAGCVLDVAARPGSRVAGFFSRSPQETSTVATLYDPQNLQVRADVRLEDLPRVAAGQAVRIQTAAVDHPLEGEVLLVTSAADVQKNTLQVKIAVKDPPAVLKPDMLVQVTFIARADADRKAAAGEQLRLFVPRQLVEHAGDGTYVWLADQAAGIARRQTVRLAGTGSGELVEIVAGLTAASRLIVDGREGLRDGQRIEVTSEDTTLGIAVDGAR